MTSGEFPQASQFLISGFPVYSSWVSVSSSLFRKRKSYWRHPGVQGPGEEGAVRVVGGGASGDRRTRGRWKGWS